jgi:large conductance mechanosensitive channel
MRKILSEFRDFIAKGNVVDLAVAVVIGAAFKAVIDSFVANIINGFLGALFGQPNFDTLTLTIGHGEVAYGKFLTQVVNFLIIGAALFVVVKAYNSLTNLRKNDGADEATAAEVTEIALLTEIRDALVQRGNAG